MKAIVTVSDLHIGSLTGLVPTRARLDGGGRYLMNKFQQTLMRYWRNFWEEFVPRETEGAESVTVVLNGDVIDGYHHNTTAVWTNDCDNQAECALGMLEPICRRYQGRMYLVRGTEAHSGPGSKAEEKIARELGLSPNEAGDYSVWQLLLDVDGVTMQFAHHIGVTSSTAYESSAPMREMVAGLVEAAQWGRKLPKVFVRSHRHRFILVPLVTETGRIQAVITPSWQLRTPFTERIDRMRMPHIGGVVFLVEGGECQVKEKVYRLPDPKPVKI